MKALCDRLVAEGLPLARTTLHARTLHPLIVGQRFLWQRGVEEIDVLNAEFALLESQSWVLSPIRMLLEEGAAAVRQRLDVPEVPLTLPLYEELRAEGLTDYVALPLTNSKTSAVSMTFATDRPGGFTTEELIELYDLLPALAPILEVHSVRRLAVNVLNTYVGRQAGELILDGRIHRGDGETINAALWYCDLRGFTALSARHDRDTLIGILNAYFEAMAEPVARYGGETLKFIGDAMLAMFPMSRRGACLEALNAALEARAAMGQLNRERMAAGHEPLGFGIALHVGDVMYGNIGAPDRLDFTVIGPAVNMVVRLQELCKTLGRTVLSTNAFASLSPFSYERIGRHHLRGLPEPITVFTPLEPGADEALALPGN
ncbi:adenylate/guanylate cyclase domain-containing protein [Marinivivus vitaminiproducens]|uniref:adenylate/guanylate cyclase domain-containing protein n=1 Tax=Marinivivus vitaminiproducens TaxID=3035935 RepID=UPI0027A1F27B|nr:adenylate/guanylate cyclase domain-containing protein [Geminicoccaceae bacterium SCSIO 64248]